MPTWRTLGPWGAFLLLGCVTEPVHDDTVQRREVEAYTTDPAGRRTADADAAPLFPPGLTAPVRDDVTSTISPYHRFSHQTIRAPDGRFTRMYWVRAGRGKQTLELIQAHTRAYADNEDSPVALTLVEKAQVDPRPTAPPKGVLATMITGVDAVSDLITVTAEDCHSALNEKSCHWRIGVLFRMSRRGQYRPAATLVQIIL